MESGELKRWADVERMHPWNALLLGNGLSINVWKGFAYSSLFEEAKEHSGPLSDDDLLMFRQFGTENFEIVLNALRTTILTAEAVGQTTDVYFERYRGIQVALGEAIRRVHLELSEVPDDARETIKDELLAQRIVFTTNYDLLLYWSMGFGDDYANLVDCLWYGSFDPSNAVPYPNKIPVYYLHGAMHLAVGGSGTTHKIVRTANENVLDQFGKPVVGDSRARPLLVTEGSSADKLRAIDANDYLTHALSRLKACHLPLVVFGSSLSDGQDAHLLDAINRHEDRPVAVSMCAGERNVVRKRQNALRARLDAVEVHFFDAATHPLGAINWSKEVESWRSRVSGFLRWPGTK